MTALSINPVKEIQKIALIGTGTITPGLAIMFAKAGHEVTLYGRSAASVADCQRRIDDALELDKALGLVIPADIHFIDSRIRRVCGTQPNDQIDRVKVADAVVGAHVVIESIVEEPAAKQAMFALLTDLTPAGTILATNTSSVPLGAIAAAIPHDRLGDFLGIHVFNPAHKVRGVEIVRNDAATADATVTQVLALMRSCGKEAVELRKATPSFVVNLVQSAIGFACFELLEKGDSADDIDLAIERQPAFFEAVTAPTILPNTSSPILRPIYMALEVAVQALVDARVADRQAIRQLLEATLAPHYRATGPLRTMDMGGLNVFRNIMTNTAKMLGKDRVPEELEALVSAGHLGAKGLSPDRPVVRGVYRWTPESLLACQLRRAEVLARETPGLVLRHGFD